MKINSNDIHEVLKLSRADNISFIGTGDITYIVAHEQKDVDFRSQIIKKIYDGGEGQTLIKRDILKLVPKNCYVEITEDTIIAGKRKIKYKPNELIDKHLIVENHLTTIEGKELDHLLSGYYAMATDMTRPILNGICIQNNEFAACDGFRITVRKGNFKATEQVVMDLNMVNTLKKIKCDKNVEVYYNDRYVKFIFGDLEVVGNRVEGNFINYKSIIPEYHTRSTTLETKELVNILKNYKKNKFEFVKLNFTTDNLIVNASNEIASIEDKTCIKLKGEPLEIAFNINYLIDSLNSYKTTTLELIAAVCPMVLKAENKLDLVLPVRIRD